MENVTIKQLLDLGANIDINFHHCKSKEDAIAKVDSLGYDGEMEHLDRYNYDGTYRISVYSSNDFQNIDIAAYYKVDKEDK